MQEIGSEAHEEVHPSSVEGSALTLGALALAVVALGRLYPGSPGLQALLWPCPLKAMTGLPCPTCGITRVAVLLAQGEVLEALLLAPLPALGLLGALVLGAWGALAAALRRPGPMAATARWRANPRVGWWLLGGALGLYGATLVRSVLTGAP